MAAVGERFSPSRNGHPDLLNCAFNLDQKKLMCVPFAKIVHGLFTIMPLLQGNLLMTMSGSVKSEAAAPIGQLRNGELDDVKVWTFPVSQ